MSIRWTTGGIAPTNLHLVVVPLKFPTQLLKLLLKTDRLAEFGATAVSFLLQRVATSLVLLVLLLQASHIRQEFARSLRQVVNLLHIIHLGHLLHQVTVGSFDLALCRPARVSTVHPARRIEGGGHSPISISWSFSPAASCSSWDILACRSRDASSVDLGAAFRALAEAAFLPATLPAECEATSSWPLVKDGSMWLDGITRLSRPSRCRS